MNWRYQAACNASDVDPGWFDANGKGIRPVEALQVCRGCPVRLQCFEEAIRHPNSEDSGVWGGTTHRARREVRYGRLTREEAMRAGDLLAEERSAFEIWQQEGTPVPELVAEEVVSEVCASCGGPSLGGGYWCLRCYLMWANPSRPRGHGTARGYLSHRNRGEVPCEDCRIAWEAAEEVA